jgi:MinD-like ATPase involved in chromosome partitioning or flagellar assembly
MMPGIDGYTVIKHLRQNSITDQIPIIIFTAKTEMEDKVLGLELGADSYLTKPISTRDLITHIKAAISRSSRKTNVIPAYESGQMISVLASRGGIGVSTVTINLGIALHVSSKKEILVSDFRPGQGMIGMDLGYKNAEGFNRLLQMSSPEINRLSIENEIIVHSSGVRLLLSSSQPHDAKYLTNTDQFESIARILPQLADFVLIDLGTGLTPIASKILPICSKVIVIIEPNQNTIDQTKLLLRDLPATGIGENQIYIIMVNRIRSSLELKLSDVQEQLGQQVSIVISPEPELTYQASLQKIPLTLLRPESLVAKQFHALVGNLIPNP